MKPKTITWENAILPSANFKNDTIGFIKGSFQKPEEQEKMWFAVKERGVRIKKYILFTYPIFNENFSRANTSKIIGSFSTMEEAKEKAQEIFNQLVNSLIE